MIWLHEWPARGRHGPSQSNKKGQHSEIGFYVGAAGSAPRRGSWAGLGGSYDARVGRPAAGPRNRCRLDGECRHASRGRRPYVDRAPAAEIAPSIGVFAGIARVATAPSVQPRCRDSGAATCHFPSSLSQGRGSSKVLPYRLWATMIALLLVEMIALSTSFDGASIPKGLGWWSSWLARSSRFASVAIAAAVAAVAFGGAPIRAELARHLDWEDRRKRFWIPLTSHLAAFGLFASITAFVFGGGLGNSSVSGGVGGCVAADWSSHAGLLGRDGGPTFAVVASRPRRESRNRRRPRGWPAGRGAGHTDRSLLGVTRTVDIPGGASLVVSCNPRPGLPAGRARRRHPGLSGLHLGAMLGVRGDRADLGLLGRFLLDSTQEAPIPAGIAAYPDRHGHDLAAQRSADRRLDHRWDLGLRGRRGGWFPLAGRVAGVQCSCAGDRRCIAEGAILRPNGARRGSGGHTESRSGVPDATLVDHRRHDACCGVHGWLRRVLPAARSDRVGALIWFRSAYTRIWRVPTWQAFAVGAATFAVWMALEPSPIVESAWSFGRGASPVAASRRAGLARVSGLGQRDHRADRRGVGLPRVPDAPFDFEGLHNRPAWAVHLGFVSGFVATLRGTARPVAGGDAGRDGLLPGVVSPGRAGRCHCGPRFDERTDRRLRVGDRAVVALVVIAGAVRRVSQLSWSAPVSRTVRQFPTRIRTGPGTESSRTGGRPMTELKQDLDSSFQLHRQNRTRGLP